jgi:hypothetical protein
MKKTITAFAVALALLSCQKEPDFTNAPANNNSSSNNNNNNSSTGTSGNDYQPTSANSKWTMKSTSLGDYTITSLGTDSMINNTKFYRFDHSIGGRQYISKENGVYKNLAFFQQLGGMVISTYLKDVAAGSTWTDVLSAAGTSVNMKYTVAAVGGQRTVNRKAYTNVIKVTYEQSAMGITTAIGEQYYAKGVGPIESVARMDMFGMQATLDSTYLVSSIIK